jgi:IS5 family transposase
MPIDPSSMTRWRQRLGEAGAEAMMKETIGAGVAMKVITSTQASHVNIDTTVQTKAIRYPTDARLYDRARERLLAHARQSGLLIRQSYARVGRHLVMKAVLYAHARQMSRSKACTRKLRTNLGRVIREVERQGVPEELTRLLTLCKPIHQQQRQDQAKLYSVHEPELICIAKGKAGKKYEFGQKVSVVVTSKDGWLLGAMCVLRKPYGGHTLQQHIQQMDRLYSKKQTEQRVLVDMGYRGHDYADDRTVIVDHRRRGETSKRMWRWMTLRAALESTIGHLKSDHLLERNGLRGTLGDSINALLSAAAMNFGKLLGFLLPILLALLDPLQTRRLRLCGA